MPRPHAPDTNGHVKKPKLQEGTLHLPADGKPEPVKTRKRLFVDFQGEQGQSEDGNAEPVTIHQRTKAKLKSPGDIARGRTDKPRSGGRER